MSGVRFPSQRYSKAWLAVPVLWMGILYYLSSLQPGDLRSAPSIPHFDKVAHFVVYGSLLVSFMPWGIVASAGVPRRWLPFAVAASLTFAVADELHQMLVPGREPEWLDLVADGMGIAVAAWCCSRRWSRKWACRILRIPGPEPAGLGERGVSAKTRVATIAMTTLARLGRRNIQRSGWVVSPTR